MASESEHCIIKREHDQCKERIKLHNSSHNLELGRRRCVSKISFQQPRVGKYCWRRSSVDSLLINVKLRAEFEGGSFENQHHLLIPRLTSRGASLQNVFSPF